MPGHWCRFFPGQWRTIANIVLADRDELGTNILHLERHDSPPGGFEASFQDWPRREAPQRSLSIWTARGSSGGMAAGRDASGTEQRTPPLTQDEFVTLPREWTDLGAACQLAKRCLLEDLP